MKNNAQHSETHNRPVGLSILISLLILLVSGPAANAETAQTHSVVEGNTAFAFDLYARLSAKQGNLFFSPYSISACLGMTYAGARGDTETQMGRVLHFTPGDARLHSSFGELQRELNGEDGMNGIQLEIANALWTQKGEPFLPAFLSIATADYEANVKQADFVRNAEGMRGEINSWVAQQTKGKIFAILPPGSLDDLTRLVLANAIYFKGAWATPFKEAETSPQPFHISMGNQADVPFMRQVNSVKCVGTAELRAVSLPYVGNVLSMVILLPRQIDGLGELEKQLTPALLDGLFAVMKPQRLRIELPKFKVESETKLNDTLAEMGMPDAFNLRKADFSGINGRRRDLFISGVFHKAWVEVSEEGTEAAAATVVAMPMGARPAPPVIFRADHPFIFLIRDNHSGSVLFMGRLGNPAM
jgi:serpin B